MSDELQLTALLADVARLRQDAGDTGPGHPLLENALSSLEQSIEELQVASEELEVKNEELVLALASLDDERKRYRDLFDLAADGYVVLDGRFVVVEANRAAGELLGQPAESVIGCRFLDLLAPGSRQEAASRLRSARAGQPAEAILLLASGPDSTRLVHARCRFRDEPVAGPQTHWTLTDLARPLFDSENATGADPRLSRSWLGIYGELVAVTEALLDAARDRLGSISNAAREHLLESEVRPLEARVAHLKSRRDTWSRRHQEEMGLEIDGESGRIGYRGRWVAMTRREQQLIRFLLGRPGTYFSARVLLARAWHASYLSEEQVRTYVSRLRRKLALLEAPCRLASERRRGYALLFD